MHLRARVFVHARACMRTLARARLRRVGGRVLVHLWVRAWDAHARAGMSASASVSASVSVSPSLRLSVSPSLRLSVSLSGS